MNRAILILAGGSGTRLWPMSTPEKPKQFHQIFEGKSLLQTTWERLSKSVSPESIRISTNDAYRDLVLEQLPVSEDQVITEPAKKNTAPAVATTAAIIARDRPGVTIGVFPSDHWVSDENAFSAAINRAFVQAESSSALGTIAIEPSRPATGFGYLELGDQLGEGVFQVKRFVEKPSEEEARRMLSEGGYAWNGGMFVWTWDSFRREMQQHAPEILSIATEIAETGDWSRYEAMPSISIDYALMEKASDVFTVKGELGWSDLGSWDVIATTIDSDASGVTLADSRNIFVKRSAEKPLAVVGLENVAIIETDEGLLVLDLEKAEAMKKL